MIPQDIYERAQSEREEILTSSIVPVMYDEGFPAFEDGQPLWSQMPFETADGYRYFGLYLEEGLESGVRLVEQVAANTNSNLPLLMDYFHLYYWKIRSRAYDQFITVTHEKKRLRRLMHCDDNHYIMASNLLKRCVDYFEALDWESIDPAVVARMIPQVVEIQRKAAGEKQFDNNPIPQSVEMILRQMTRVDHATAEGESADKSMSIQTLLTDPKAAEIAQELIVRMGVRR
jgi:hypothetical protein